MKHSLTVTLFLVVLFLAAQYIGLAVVNSYIDHEATERTGNFTVYALPSVAGFKMERPDLEEDTSYLYIIAAVLVGTLLILLLIRFHQVNIWKVWFFLAVAICLTYALATFIGGTIAGLLGVVFALWKVLRPNFYIHNLTELFVYAGLAAIFFPVINVLTAGLLLLLISLYDMYAVWKSKHMVKMATFQKDSGMFAGLVLPYKWPRIGVPAVKAKKETVPTAILGGGDIGFPLLFAAAVLKQSGFAPAAIIPVFAGLALLLLLFLAKKDKFYPAMPFITAGCAVGWALSLLVG